MTRRQTGECAVPPHLQVRHVRALLRHNQRALKLRQQGGWYVVLEGWAIPALQGASSAGCWLHDVAPSSVPTHWHGRLLPASLQPSARTCPVSLALMRK